MISDIRENTGTETPQGRQHSWNSYNSWILVRDWYTRSPKMVRERDRERGRGGRDGEREREVHMLLKTFSLDFNQKLELNFCSHVASPASLPSCSKLWQAAQAAQVKRQLFCLRQRRRARAHYARLRCSAGVALDPPTRQTPVSQKVQPVSRQQSAAEGAWTGKRLMIYPDTCWILTWLLRRSQRAVVTDSRGCCCQKSCRSVFSSFSTFPGAGAELIGVKSNVSPAEIVL